MKIGRNDLCPCGSGKKYKKCCMYKPNITIREPIETSDWIAKNSDAGMIPTQKDIEFMREQQKDLPKDICDKCGNLEVIHEYQEGYGFLSDMPKRKLCFACMEFRD